MSVVLIVTFDGGGNVPPALRLASELVSRGHAVTVLGHAAQRDAIVAAGASPREYRSMPPWDPQVVRGSLGFALSYLRLFTDAGFGRETTAAIEGLQPDVVIVDALLPAAIVAAEEADRPTVVLVHTVLEGVRSMARGPVGRVAAARGFSFERGLAGADSIVIASPQALATGSAPRQAEYVGPLFGPGELVPAAADPYARRVLLSLSTIHYVGMARVYQSLLDALEDVDADVVATTGPALDPGVLRVPRNAELVRAAPHSGILPRIGLVIGHGGHGTATRSVTAGVPVLVRALSPLGDHLAVAAGLEHAGVGRRISRRQRGAGLTAAIEAALDDPVLHERAQRVGAALRALDGPRLAADIVERTSDRRHGVARRTAA